MQTYTVMYHRSELQQDSAFSKYKSHQVAVIRGQSLIINLPGQPKAIAETLEGLKDADGKQLVNGIFAAVPYCIDLIGGPYLETVDAVCKAFRPKSAIRAPQG